MSGSRQDLQANLKTQIDYFKQKNNAIMFNRPQTTTIPARSLN
jgi:hypothetical protein